MLQRTCELWSSRDSHIVFVFRAFVVCVVFCVWFVFVVCVVVFVFVV